MSRWMLVAVALAAAGCGNGATATTAGEKTPVQATAPEGAIVFHTERDGDSGLYVTAPDGSGQRRISPLPTNEGDPDWSPDGKRIAYMTPGSASIDIYVRDVASGEVTQVTYHSADDALPDWSGDGTRLAFVRDEDIYVVAADGSGERNLTRNEAFDFEPAWSPDSTRIAYTSEDGIRIMAADGSGSRLLETGGCCDTTPAWSPGGRSIAFDRNGESGPGLYVVGANGGEPRKVPGTGAEDGGPAWSPDGSRLAFHRGEDDARELYSIRLDGTGLRRLTTNDAYDGWPDWGVADPGAAAAAPPPSDEVEDGEALVADDFSDPASGWDVEDNRGFVLEYTDGAYRIAIKDARDELIFSPAPMPFDAVERVVAEASAIEEAAGRGYELHGLLCFADRDHAYFGGIVPALGYYQILRLDRSGPRLLGDGSAPAAAPPGEPNELRLVCTGGRRAEVTLSVNGRPTATASDRRGFRRFENVGFLVVSEKGGASIVFDDVSARRG